MERHALQIADPRRQVRRLSAGLLCRRLREIADMDPDERGARRPLEPGALDRAIARLEARERRANRDGERSDGGS
jgi:hypothetical protein